MKQTRYCLELSLIIVLVSISFLLQSCGTAQKGAMIRAYKSFEKNECNEVLKILSQAESYKDPSPDLKAEMSYLRAQCFEKQSKFREAEGTYNYIITMFPHTEYAFRAKERKGIGSTRDITQVRADTVRVVSTEAQAPVKVRCSIASEDLLDGKGIKVGDRRGSVALEIENSGKESLLIGTDIFILLAGQRDKLAYLVNSSGLSTDDQHVLLYATMADYFTALNEGKLVTLGFTAWGSQLRFDESITSHYKGSWPSAIVAGGTASIRQQLVTWPETDRGWVASPVLKFDSRQERFRILGKLGLDGSVIEASVIPMEKEALAALARDESKPIGVRCWAIDWLASIDGAEQSVITALKSVDLPSDIRKTAARWSAVWLPHTGLFAISEVLWDKGTPSDLQEACYFALDWALISPRTKAEQPEAWKQIARAVEHPNLNIKTAAKKKLAEKK